MKNNNETQQDLLVRLFDLAAMTLATFRDTLYTIERVTGVSFDENDIAEIAAKVKNTAISAGNRA